MLVQHVQKYYLTPKDELYQWCLEECSKHAKLYNRALYIRRQVFTGHKENVPEEYSKLIQKDKFISRVAILNTMCKVKDEAFLLPTKRNSAQQTVIRMDNNWVSWLRALKAYKKCPEKFLGRPRMPHYYKKVDLAQVCFSKADAVLKDGYIRLQQARKSKPEIKLPFKTTLTEFQQVRLIPKIGRIEVEIAYNKEIQPKQLDTTGAVGCDVGVNILMAITSNVDNNAFLVNGRPLKSMNQYYHKTKAQIMSELTKDGLKTSKRLERLCFKHDKKVNDYLHKASRMLVNYMIETNQGTLFYGKNNYWKQECNIGKRNDQNFCSIPHYKLYNMLQYKLNEAGGQLVEVNESHTSKCSFLDNESIEHHDKYIGTRKKRGLFQSTRGQIHADINGSLNIIKKGSGMSFIPSKAIFNPRKISIDKNHSIPSNRIVCRDHSAMVIVDSEMNRHKVQQSA